jgi:hypothetical protein
MWLNVRMKEISVSEGVDLLLLAVKMENGDCEPGSILVLLSEGCHKQASQSCCLKTEEIYFLPVLQARNIKSCCQQICGPFAEQNHVFLASWYLLVAGFLGLWPPQFSLCLHLYIAFSLVCLVNLPLLHYYKGPTR